MKPKKNVSYFPVNTSEQSLLLRVRESDLAGRADELVEMLGQIAEVRLTPADLEQAIQLLLESRQGEGLEARFDNLEGRLKGRIEKGLTEIEGRLSKWLTGATLSAEPPTPTPEPSMKSPSRQPGAGAPTPAEGTGVPTEASLAFRIGPELVWGPSAAQFYVAMWRWLFEHGRIKLADMPIRSGRTRYAVAAEPVHPSGKEFTRSAVAVPGAYVEVNLSREDIVRRAKKYLGQRGVLFDVIVGSEG